MGRSHSLIQILLQHRHRRNDLWLSTGRQTVQLDVARDHVGHKLGVSSGTRSTASNVVGDVVDLHQQEGDDQVSV